MSYVDLVVVLVVVGNDCVDVDGLLCELWLVGVIQLEEVMLSVIVVGLLMDYLLQVLVFNVINQCNLVCIYCYEFGLDKIVMLQGKLKYMMLEMVKVLIDFLFESLGDWEVMYVIFFGGEMLMNFWLFRDVVVYVNDWMVVMG